MSWIIISYLVLGLLFSVGWSIYHGRIAKTRRELEDELAGIIIILSLWPIVVAIIVWDKYLDLLWTYHPNNKKEEGNKNV